MVFKHGDGHVRLTGFKISERDPDERAREPVRSRGGIVLAALALACSESVVAGVYDAVLYCNGTSTNWTTGEPVDAELTIFPAENTDRPLLLGGVPGYELDPLTQGVGLTEVVWNDGVLGLRRDRALQLTQPGDDKRRYEPIEMPLVLIGFRAAASGSIPLLVQVEVHREGIPFTAWLPGKPTLLKGNCEER